MPVSNEEHIEPTPNPKTPLPEEEDPGGSLHNSISDATPGDNLWCVLVILVGVLIRNLGFVVYNQDGALPMLTYFERYESIKATCRAILAYAKGLPLSDIISFAVSTPTKQTHNADLIRLVVRKLRELNEDDEDGMDEFLSEIYGLSEIEPDYMDGDTCMSLVAKGSSPTDILCDESAFNASPHKAETLFAASLEMTPAQMLYEAIGHVSGCEHLDAKHKAHTYPFDDVGGIGDLDIAQSIGQVTSLVIQLFHYDEDNPGASICGIPRCSKRDAARIETANFKINFIQTHSAPVARFNRANEFDQLVMARTGLIQTFTAAMPIDAILESGNTPPEWRRTVVGNAHIDRLDYVSGLTKTSLFTNMWCPHEEEPL